ncbi:MAG: NAD(P)H-hydrate dehydratase [Anaerolineae bacterium]
MKLVTAEEMRRIEATAEAEGTPIPTLMQRAGGALAEAILSDYSLGRGPILILVGPGNNGGDGLVAATRLREAGADVSAYIWRHKSDDPVYVAAAAAGVPLVRAEEDEGGARLAEMTQGAAIIVDALLGTGVTRPITGELADILARVRENRDRSASIVAVDLPSGVNSDSGAADSATLAADLTITFGFPKRGLYQYPGAGLAGHRETADIGLNNVTAQEVRVELMQAEWVRDRLPARPADAHKGTFGKALIIAGSANYTGAAYLAGSGAIRVGVGLATLGVAQMLYPILAARLVETTWLLLPHDMGALRADAAKVVLEKLEGYKAVLVGPGLGQEPATEEFVHRLLIGKQAEAQRARRIGFATEPTPEEETPEAPKLPPTVIDADALNALAKVENWSASLTAASAILTPHPGEMGRLLGSTTEEVQADRVATAKGAAEKFGQVVVLKGANTVIAAPDGQIAVSPFANPALATAGSGDVLAGAIVGFLAQGLSPFDAAACGVYVHGLAGERARLELGEAGVIASDLLLELPLAIQALRLEGEM